MIGFLKEILRKGRFSENFRVEHDFSTIGHKTLLLNVRTIDRKGRQPALILLAMEEDKTEP
jgi:hypothetical protein